ncbi:MAG: 3-deoxy-D-manno-octulosonic acid transferase [Terriglobales bacterium]
MDLLYSALLALAAVLTSPFWLLRMLRYGKYRAGLKERLGNVPERLRDSEQRPTIWVHAVSVGELMAVSGLIGDLQQRFPSHRVVISTTTMTGQKLARERFGENNAFYFPLDFAFAVRPHLRALRPELVVIAETEFWPNFLRLAKDGGARVAVVNARISDRSFPRYLRFRGWIQAVLRRVDLFLAQSEEDQRRLLEIGAPAERVQVSGNLKFDTPFAAEMPIVASVRAGIEREHAGPVLVCGSTVEGEEAMLLRSFTAIRERYASAVLVLAPRHTERFEAVADQLASSRIAFRRRSQWNPGDPIAGGVFLLDSLGELSSMYALADVAFVGGSLVPKGGHNILEAAQHGRAIIVGPHTENFRDIIALFRRANAVVVTGAGDLTRTFLDLLADGGARAGLGQRARDVLRMQSGATARTVAALESLLRSAAPNAVSAPKPKVSPPVQT